jgi:hypothetical protein
MKHSIAPAPPLFLLLFFTLFGPPASILADTIEWTGGGDGISWTDPLNWTPEQVPGAADDAVIGAAFADVEVNIPGTRSIASLDAASSLRLSSGTLTITGPGQIGGDLVLVNNTTLTMQGAGADLTVAGAVDVPNANLRALDGATIDFSSVTAITRSSNGNRTWEARGAGSVIDLSGLQTLVGRSYISSATTFLAREGGFIDLATLPSVGGGTIHFNVQDAGSVIDLSALTTFSGYMWSSVAGFTAINSGTLTAPLLTVVSSANLVLDGTGSMATTQIQTWNSGTLIVDFPGLAFDSLTQLVNARLELRGHVPALPALANIDSCTILISGGVTLNLPLVTSYTNGSNETREISVSGTGSRLELPNLTTMQGYSYIGRNTDVLANAGGVIDLPALTTVLSGAMWYKADGDGSRIQLPLLESSTATSGAPARASARSTAACW